MVKEKDIFVRLFIQTLEEGVKLVSYSLPQLSTLMGWYREKILHPMGKEEIFSILTEFSAVKKKPYENVEFTKIFKNIYKRIPNEMKPMIILVMLNYAIAFGLDFSITMREIRVTNLVYM